MTAMTSTEIVRLCEEQGFRTKETRSGFVIYGKDGQTTVGLHKSKPSDWRAHRKRVCDLRRIGVTV